MTVTEELFAISDAAAPAALELWLKTTITGIICLGALGSIVAVSILKCATYICNFNILLHRNKSRKQAFMLGFAARLISEDETGRTLVSVLVFHLMYFIAATTVLLFSSIIFIAILASQSGMTLTVGGAISSGIGFTAFYVSYFEFEYIYRTYLFFWKEPLKRAEEAYSNRQKRD